MYLLSNRLRSECSLQKRSLREYDAMLLRIYQEQSRLHSQTCPCWQYLLLVHILKRKPFQLLYKIRNLWRDSFYTTTALQSHISKATTNKLARPSPICPSVRLRWPKHQMRITHHFHRKIVWKLFSTQKLFKLSCTCSHTACLTIVEAGGSRKCSFARHRYIQTRENAW